MHTIDANSGPRNRNSVPSAYLLEVLGNEVEEMFSSRDHVWRVGSQGSQQTWSCGIILRKTFKNSCQRGANVTLESFVGHRRLQDSAVAGIHVNGGRIAYLE